MDAQVYSAFELMITDKVNMPHVIHYISRRLLDYDLCYLESIKLLPLNKRAILHGHCVYPVRSAPRARTFKSGYQIRASVNVEMAPPYVYQHWGRIPSRKFKQGWYSGEKIFVFNDLDDAAVHTLAHECFHFLSHSGQVEIKNTEANANWWADQWTADFQLIR